jgi:beta-alanine degradation protein BauB
MELSMAADPATTILTWGHKPTVRDTFRGPTQENDMAGMDISKLKLGPIGDRVMYENELVRVWDFVVEPGKSKGWHRHELPYVIIPMTDGDIELESALTGDIERPKGKIGEPIWRDAGEVHDLRNVGKDTYRNILIELKPRE